MPVTTAALTDGVISQRASMEVVRETATLSMGDRAEVDRRIGPDLHRRPWRMAGRAAARVAAGLDAASVVPRMDAAVGSRRVTVRPAPDGIPPSPSSARSGRSSAPTPPSSALRLLSGRAVGLVLPVAVQLVMTDRSLLGTGDPDRSWHQPARVPGHGSVAAPVAPAWVRDAEPASVWIRRLYPSPDGRDLVAMDSRRIDRCFPAA